MNMFHDYVPAIISVIFVVAVLGVQCLRSAWRKRQQPISWDYVEPEKEFAPGLAGWIAGAIVEDFDEEMEELAKEEAPPSEPVTPKRMLLTDVGTGVEMDLEIGVLLGEDGKEVADLHKATDALCKDDEGRWWDVSLKDFSWDRPTIH